MKKKIETERLIIRDYNVNDFNDYYDYIMEPELQRMLGLEEVTDKTSAYRNFEWLMNNRTFLTIEEKSTTKAIGHICLHPPYSALSESEEFKGRVGYSISYAISTDRRRKGYMEEALRNLINSMFQSSEADYFFIDKTKIEAVKTFIHEPDDIVIQAKPWNDRYISLDGHTRLYLAVEKGYKTVKATISESDDWVWPFVEEAAKRGITTPKDMQLLPHDQYEIQWNQYCNSIFENDNN